MRRLGQDQSDRFNAALAGCFGEAPPKKLGIALSGGGDSTALLVLLADWAATHDVRLSAATINHHLRPEAKAEITQAADLCADLNVPHQVLHWRDWGGQGNLQAAARQARLTLLTGWAKGENLNSIALGHTLDDQAETVLLRLLRGSGVDGLSGMQAHRVDGAMHWLRPLLGYRREELRDLLKDLDIPWSEDPSNQDPRFDRVASRRALDCLEDLGLTAEGLANTAERLQQSRNALELATKDAARATCQITPLGEVLIDRAGFLNLPEDIGLRLMAHALKWVAGNPYRPRMSALSALITTVTGTGKRAVLGGCLVTPQRDGKLRIGREAAAVAGLTTPVTALWDGRWRACVPPEFQDAEIRALGENGLKLCDTWRDAGLPRDGLITAPSVWRKGQLLAVPFAAQLAEMPQGCALTLEKGQEHFYSSVLSH
jgi:tRNA(Ile)-lysidine synthase